MTFSELDTGIKNVRNVSRFTFGQGSLVEVSNKLKAIKEYQGKGVLIFFVDKFFADKKN